MNTAVTSVTVGQPASLVASLPATTNLCSGSCVTLTPSIAGGTPMYTYSWSPLAGLSSGILPNPSACLLTSTTYTLTVADTHGCVDTATTTVTLLPYSWPDIGPDITLPCGTTNFHISCASTVWTTTYNWVVPSGFTIASGAGTTDILVIVSSGASVTSPFYVTASPGTGCPTNSDTANVTITTPGINFTINPDSANAYIYHFFNATPGTILSYSWDFGDGSALSTAASPSHTYAGTGVYTICLSVTTSTCSGSLCDSVIITGVTNPCNALFNIAHDTTSPNPNAYVVTNLSYGATLTYYWDFGDGGFDVVAHPTHIYPGIGPYWLCLTVDDGLGCNTTFCDSIYAVDSLHSHLQPIQITVVDEGMTVGITNTDDAGAWLISPNPTTGDFKVASSKYKIKEIKMFDVLGQCVYHSEINNSKYTINISQLPKGIYFVELTTLPLLGRAGEGLVVRRKIIKE